MKDRPSQIWAWRAIAGELAKPNLQHCGLIPIRRKQSWKMKTMVLKWEITKGQFPEKSEVQEHRDCTVTLHLPGLKASLCTTYLTKKYVCKMNLMNFSSPYSSHLRFYRAMQVKFLHDCRLCLVLVSWWKYTNRKIRFNVCGYEAGISCLSKCRLLNHLLCIWLIRNLMSFVIIAYFGDVW
jgi:hypothetical protein